MDRRVFIATLSAVPGAGAALSSGQAAAKVLRPVPPRRLAAGQTVGIVAPASATFRSVDVATTTGTIRMLAPAVR
jgi:hypothetical protein